MGYWQRGEKEGVWWTALCLTPLPQLPDPAVLFLKWLWGLPPAISIAFLSLATLDLFASISLQISLPNTRFLPFG